MKSKVVKIGVSSILFFSMILAALALVRPAIRGFSQQLETYGKDFLAMVESKTGLQVSYDSLSPAILSVFRIKGIVVSDGETKIPVHVAPYPMDCVATGMGMCLEKGNI